MDIQDYFKQKKKLEEAKVQLSDNIVSLTSRFNDSYYYTMSKRVFMQSDKLMCDFNTCLYVPGRENNEVFIFNFPVKLHLGSYKNPALEQFNGFSCNTMTRTVTSDRALFLMYPDISFKDITEDEQVSIFRNVIFKTSASIYKTTFEDFLQTVPQKAMEFLKEIHFKSEIQTYTKILTPKEEGVIEKKFNALISRIISDFEADRSEGFKLKKLLENKLVIQTKLLHHKLTSEIPISDYKKGKKI